MAKVKYIAGDSVAEEVEFHGYTFTDGKSVEVKDEDLHKFQRGNPYFEVAGEATAKPAATPKPKVKEPEVDGEPKGPFKVREETQGWFAILDRNGNQVGKKVREEDALAFEEMSDAEQAEYLK